MIRVGVDLRAFDAWEAKALRAVKSLGGTWTAAVVLATTAREPYPTVGKRTKAPAASTNAEVLNSLEAGGRDLFRRTAALTLQVMGLVRADVRRRGLLNLAGAALYMIVATHWRTAVVARARRGEGFKRPGARWAARKAQLGLHAGPMQASGQLLEAVEAAQLIVERKR